MQQAWLVHLVLQLLHSSTWHLLGNCSLYRSRQHVQEGKCRELQGGPEILCSNSSQLLGPLKAARGCLRGETTPGLATPPLTRCSRQQQQVQAHSLQEQQQQVQAHSLQQQQQQVQAHSLAAAAATSAGPQPAAATAVAAAGMLAGRGQALLQLEMLPSMAAAVSTTCCCDGRQDAHRNAWTSAGYSQKLCSNSSGQPHSKAAAATWAAASSQRSAAAAAAAAKDCDLVKQWLPDRGRPRLLQAAPARQHLHIQQPEPGRKAGH